MLLYGEWLHLKAYKLSIVQVVYIYEYIWGPAGKLTSDFLSEPCMYVCMYMYEWTSFSKYLFNTWFKLGVAASCCEYKKESLVSMKSPDQLLLEYQLLMCNPAVSN
jgi:hypothetical protein